MTTVYLSWKLRAYKAEAALRQIIERSTHHPLGNRLQDIREIAETALRKVENEN